MKPHSNLNKLGVSRMSGEMLGDVREGLDKNCGTLNGRKFVYLKYFVSFFSIEKKIFFIFQNKKARNVFERKIYDRKNKS